MLHLNFGNRLEPLADALALELDRAWTDPLSPPTVVVPTPSVGRWLKLRLASRGRTVLNLATTALERFLWDCLEPAEGDRILRVDMLQHAVCCALDARLLAEPDFQELQRFLSDGAGGIDPARRVQIGREMARLFLEYEYNRPSVWREGHWAVEGIDRAWPRRPYFDSESESRVEKWQRRLHGIVFDPSGPLEGTGFLGLPRLHRIRREEGWTGAGAPVFLLSVDKTSHFHRNLLLELSETREIHLFLVNPCMEFWEDVDTSRSRRGKVGRKAIPLRRLQTEEYGASELPPDFWKSEVDPPLLGLWGKTARENTALWCQAANHDFGDHFEEAGEESLLRSLQSSLLRRDPGPLLREVPEAPCRDDGSLRILAAPESLREMEAVRDAVCQWLSEDPKRRPSEAAVYLPDPQARATEIDAVFGSLPPGDPGRIPYSVVGVSGSESLWACGARLLLRCWTEGLDRELVLGISRNGLVRRRRGWTESDTASWARWSMGSGMLRGWDAADRISRGESESFASDVHTLKAGLVRLSLSALASRPVSGGLSEGASSQGVPPWRDRESADLEELDLFLEQVDDLHRDLQSPPRGTLLEQGRRFLSLCDSWMDASADPVEDSLRRAVVDGIGLFSLRGDDPIEPGELAECLRSLLEEELPASGSAWTGALTFAPLRPGHILPHGLVVVAGLDESFPGEPRQATLDLLSRGRIVGDSDGVAENRHAFLLGLLSARDRLVLSWTARDLRKDVKRMSSSVVFELEATLRDGFLGRESEPVGVRRAVPLLSRTGGILEEDPPAWEAPSWNPDDAPRGIEPVQEVPAPVPENPSLEDLGSFLQSPFLHRVGVKARHDEVDDTLTDFPLVPDLLSFHGLCSGGLDRLWKAGRSGGSSAASGEDVARELIRTVAWDEGIPEGDFLGATLDRMGTWIESVRRGLVEHLGEGVPLHREVQLADLLRREGREVPDLPAARCRWVAGVPGQGRWSLADLVSFETRSAKPEKKARLYLAGAWLRAAGWTDPVELLWIERMGDGRVAKEILPESADGSWLADLLADCRDPSVSQHVPLHAAVGKDVSRISLESEIENERRHRSELERLLEPSLPDLPDAELQALVERWFRPWRSP